MKIGVTLLDRETQGTPQDRYVVDEVEGKRDGEGQSVVNHSAA